ncbi:unnamed protein product, partial [Sphacelaria rigidula]
VNLARPGRPPADASSASRLISGALGIRKPREKREVTPTAARKVLGASAKTSIGRDRRVVSKEPAESTDSWDM